MKTKILVWSLFVTKFIFAQNFPYKISRIAELGCESRVKVKDERPADCFWGGDNYFYPVLVENFDFKEDLPNNWIFKNGNQNDEAFEENNSGITWMGDPYGHGNVYTSGGIGYFETIKEFTTGAPNSTLPVKAYNFTGGLLKSLFGMKQGVFEARIKFPNDPNYWPAYWLNGKIIDQEIDIIESYDNDLSNNNTVSNCEVYEQMNMTLHNRTTLGNNPDCVRSKKFPLVSNFFNSYHTFKCLWTDFRVDIYLDGTLVGYATKYYDGPYSPAPSCTHHAASGIPAYTRDCYWMKTAQECNLIVSVPNWPDFWNFHQECSIYNKVDKDLSFPKTSSPMYMILDAIINNKNQNCETNLINSWGSLSIDQKRMGVDWIKIYQPFQCGAFRNVSTINDVKSITGNTNFLTGDKIQVGTAANVTTFSNTMQFYYQGLEFPLHFLVASEIEINGDAIFEEGTYLRAEVVSNCSTVGFNEYQGKTDNRGKLFLTDEEIAEIEKNQLDSMMHVDPSFRDSINDYNQKNNLPVNEIRSSNDNGAIVVFPNPTNGLVYFDMNDEDFNDLIRVELIDNLGQKVVFPKTDKINLVNFSPGVYYLKFIFTHGHVVDKKITKE